MRVDAKTIHEDLERLGHDVQIASELVAKADTHKASRLKRYG